MNKEYNINTAINKKKSIFDKLKEAAYKKNPYLITYRDFIKIALYDEDFGYYTNKTRFRVGKTQENDFYTAQSLHSNVFQELVLSAIKNLCSPAFIASATFVELGAEPQKGLLKDTSHPFLNYKSLSRNDPLDFPEKSIIFANELLDAQPFHRLIFKNNKWQELGIKVHDTHLEETILPNRSERVQPYLKDFPKETSEGYIIDFPLDAQKLLEKIAAKNWQGLLILLDYGKYWQELIHEYPQGTARSYFKHRLISNLIENPGKQDITCHICWDPLKTLLKKNRFTDITCKTQESFFMHNAREAISKLLANNSSSVLNPSKQALLELLHPAHFGAKFQVLCAKRNKDFAIISKT